MIIFQFSSSSDSVHSEYPPYTFLFSLFDFIQFQIIGSYLLIFEVNKNCSTNLPWPQGPQHSLPEFDQIDVCLTENNSSSNLFLFDLLSKLTLSHPWNIHTYHWMLNYRKWNATIALICKQQIIIEIDLSHWVCLTDSVILVLSKTECFIFESRIDKKKK